MASTEPITPPIPATDTTPAEKRPRREVIRVQFARLIQAIRTGDESMAEEAVLALSRRSRWLAPLAAVVGAFTMLFVGLKTVVTNWRLALVQVLPAMWIWLAMLDLKVHIIHGRELRTFYGLWIIPAVSGVALITAAAFYLNAVFAFAIGKSGPPEIRPAFIEARRHRATVLSFGFVTGIALGFAIFVAPRWGLRWYALILGIVVGFMMFTYVLIPSRLIGVKSTRSKRDQLSATVIGGAVGAMLCSPPYFLGRVALIMLGSHNLRVIAVVLLAIAIVLQTGATSAVKAVKMSMKLMVTGDTGDDATEASVAPPMVATEEA